MPKIGEFRQTDYGYEGEVSTPELVSTYQIRRSIEPQGSGGPDYTINAPNGAEVGAAWDKVSNQNNNAYLRLSIDDPVRSEKIQANMVNEGNGRWGVLFNRANDQSKSGAPQEPRDMSETMRSHGEQEVPVASAPEQTNGRGR